MERHFFVKQKVSGIGTGRHKNCGLGMIFQHRAINFNVGIGTTSPTEKLEVSGNIKLTGRIRQGSMGDMAGAYAMKANPPKMGTIIGKAMEKLEEDEGIIMVFVTRQ